MHLLVVDPSRAIIGDLDISGTTWEVTYNALFNQDVLRVTSTAAGKPAFIEVRDDTLTIVLSRMPFTHLSWLACGDTVIIARGGFVWSPLVLGPDQLSGTTQAHWGTEQE